MGRQMTGRIDVVVKLGGQAMADDVLATVSRVIRNGVLVVPGGGAFADAVRAADREKGLPASTAHWMAVLAMDQSAYVVADGLGGVVVETPGEKADRIPVLAPYRWLREADPLPHGWHVTSDSIAAWVAGQVGARRLVLVKPPGVEGRDGKDIVDEYFAQALPEGLSWTIVTTDRLETLPAAIGEVTLRDAGPDSARAIRERGR